MNERESGNWSGAASSSKVSEALGEKLDYFYKTHDQYKIRRPRQFRQYLPFLLHHFQKSMKTCNHATLHVNLTFIARECLKGNHDGQADLVTGHYTEKEKGRTFTVL
jgi:hypothetical protein